MFFAAPEQPLTVQSLPLQDLHPSATPNDANVDHVQEQAMVHNALELQNALSCGMGVYHGLPEVQVHDVVAIFGYVRLA